MPKHPRARVAMMAIGFGALCILYLYGLDRTGLIGPDEPRYAAIGRHMAQSGDWIMPVLWGRPWFEKPPLLYWMTAIGFDCGLGPDLAPRLPVALLSVSFLAFFYARLRRFFDNRTAAIGTAMLATCMGWLAYSRVAVTDLPLAVTFSASMLLLMTATSWAMFAAAGALLGLAILAKALVPLVLVIPALWFRRRRWPMLIFAFAVAIAIAAPWYIAVYARAGRPFLYELFWTQQFGRFLTAERQHVQPFWFYVPVILAGMLPWTPALALVRKGLLRDRRAQFLAGWFVWGLVFFSAATNKLPGYALPLLPPLCAVAAAALDRTVRAPWVLAAGGVLLSVFSIAEAMLPGALLNGLRGTGVVVGATDILISLAIAVASGLLERAGRRMAAVGLIGAGAAGFVLAGVVRTLPLVDRAVSARSAWRSGQECLPEGASRELVYGLKYYASKDLAPCPRLYLKPDD